MVFWAPANPAGTRRKVPLDWANENPNVIVRHEDGAELRINCRATGFIADHRDNSDLPWPGRDSQSELIFYVSLEIGVHHARHGGVPGLAAGPMPSGKYALISDALTNPPSQGIGAVPLYTLAVYAQQSGVTWIRTGATANTWRHNFLGGDPLNFGGDFNIAEEVFRSTQHRGDRIGWKLQPIAAHRW